ncbi:hypothetical protein DY000_02040216 [Brassica cretica]|uniref:Uncharacterized protein n=1 Tax=Brassica cretica TaxID=69181 RepID=A0ABQ7BDB9_BRACR|nr:hypothetical protein DY000_02040216 [Brassica cretica]
MVGVRRLSPGVDQNINMIKSGKGRGSGHDLLGDGPMVGMHGLGGCIDWFGDWLNLLRLEYADRNLESWVSVTSHVLVWVLDGPLDKIFRLNLYPIGETCIYDDQDVISEKEQGGRCNEMVRKNQSTGDQLTSAWRSVPVRTSVAGSKRLPSRPDGPCGTMSPGAILAEPGNETKAWGSWFPCGSGSERFWAKRQKEKEKEMEKDLAPGDRTPKVNGVVRKPLDIAGDFMVLNHGLGWFRNEAHGLSRAVHDQDPYDPGRFIGF